MSDTKNDSGSGTQAAFLAGISAGVAPSGQLAIYHRGRCVLSIAAGGGAELQYDLASLTKILSTSFLVAKALSYGLCTLDDPLARFVPQAPEHIRLRSALGHSSGLPAHKHFDERLRANAIASGTREAFDFCVRQAAREPLVYETDTRIIYSDLGFILLGAALERMFAEPLSALIRRGEHGVFYRDHRDGAPPPSHDLFAPTGHLPRGEGLDRVPVHSGYIHDGNCRAMGGVSGHAGLFGTANAVAHLGERWLRASRGEDDAFLRQPAVEQIWSDAPVIGRTCGWDRSSPPGSHTGDVWPLDTVGHLGFTGTSLWLSPSANLVVGLVVNRGAPMAELKAYRRAVHAAAWAEFGAAAV